MPIQYDGRGNLLRFEGPNFTSTYNPRNQLTSYRGKDGKWQNFEYNEVGKITTECMSSAGLRGTTYQTTTSLRARQDARICE